MNQLRIIEIKKVDNLLIYSKWSDGFESTISLEQLRKSCPCAECTGESVGDKIYSMPKVFNFEPGQYDLVGIKTVGNYALNMAWANGHHTGIYNWDRLRTIFEQNQLIDDELNKLKEKQKSDKRNITFNVIKK